MEILVVLPGQTVVTFAFELLGAACGIEMKMQCLLVPVIQRQLGKEREVRLRLVWRSVRCSISAPSSRTMQDNETVIVACPIHSTWRSHTAVGRTQGACVAISVSFPKAGGRLSASDAGSVSE